VVVGIAGQHIRSIQHTDYISRNNPEEVIGGADIQLLIDQVNKLAMPGEEIIHVLPQEFKIDKMKLPIDVWWKTRSKFSCCCRTSSVYKECRRCIQSSGIELSGLTLEPLASSQF
jgi:cell division protein FtsA